MTRGWHRWTKGACLVAVLLAALVGVPSALADPSPAQAIAELNAWRAQIGESPVSTADVPLWDTGCQNHNLYEHLNGNALTHPETMGTGYTPSGAIAGPDSVLGYNFSAPAVTPDSQLLPGPVWDAAVFHRVPLLQPRLANIGYNSTTFPGGGGYTTFTCLWDQNGPTETAPYVPPYAIDNSRTTPALTLYPSPANGAVDVPTTFPAGTESPDPATETGVPPGATLGWLLNVEINGPWATAGGGGIVFAHDVTATLAPNGTSTPVSTIVSECGSAGCASAGGTLLGPYMGGGFGIFPTQALAPNTTYLATATGTVTDASVPKSIPFSIHWCFSTGPTYTPGGQCTASTTGAGLEPGLAPANLTVSIAGSGSVSGSGISCPGTCTGGYAPGSPVTLTATPAAGHKFVGWSGGACAGSTPTCQLTLSADTSVTATFAAMGAPKISRASLSVSSHKAKLAFSLTRGTSAPPIKKVVVKLPGGLTFSSKARSLKKGISIAGHPGFKASASHAQLTITLTGTTAQLRLTISTPAVTVSKALAKKLAGKKRTTLTFTVRATDATGTTTTLRLTFKSH